MTCCFIGHRKVETTDALEQALNIIITHLISIGIENFIFGDHSVFNDLCYNIVTKLKIAYLQICRIKYRKDYPDANEYTMQFLIKGFEYCIIPNGVEKSGKAAYIKRNQAMICHSDYCIFYYSENYKPHSNSHNASRKSGTKLAFDYAKAKHKNILNVYDFI